MLTPLQYLPRFDASSTSRNSSPALGLPTSRNPSSMERSTGLGTPYQFCLFSASGRVFGVGGRASGPSQASQGTASAPAAAREQKPLPAHRGLVKSRGCRRCRFAVCECPFSPQQSYHAARLASRKSCAPRGMTASLMAASPAESLMTASGRVLLLSHACPRRGAMSVAESHASAVAEWHVLCDVLCRPGWPRRWKNRLEMTRGVATACPAWCCTF